ncbi:MAG: sulfatase-like hydrolase/transferase, partial [Silvanigrellaceae bacterium]|nr:sulfatase-like hydrolase/transferase [Silvanigrellaceae bacterium]
IKKLKELGIYDDVDIIVTSDHGAQMDVQPWYYFLGVNQNIDGGYADKGNSLFDEEVRVPLIMHFAKNNRLNGSTISIPTAHVDLFPTLYHLAGGNNMNPLWRGIDLYPALKEENDIDLPNLLSKRDTIYFDGHKYAGILYWGENFKNSPMKYMRQLAPDNVKLYLTHNPWSEKISWYQPEMFSSVDFSKNSEKLLPNVSNQNLKALRTAYFNSSPSSKIIRFTPKYDGKFSLNIQFNLNGNEEIPKVALIPDGLKLEEIKNKNSILFNFNGNLKSDEGIWINIGNGNLNKIELEKNITAITCANGNKVDHNLIVSILENNICTFFAPPDGIIEANYKSSDKPVVIQKTLSSEQVQQLEGTGAGAALQNALRDWGYAK